MTLPTKTPKVSAQLFADQSTSSVATPPASTVNVYNRAGYLITENSSGVETLAGNVTFPAINYVQNPHPVGVTDGWVMYADAAGATPVDGTGGSPASTWTRNTSSPLHSPADFKLTKSAANRQGEGVSYDFTIENMYTSRLVDISFDVNSDGSYAAGDAVCYIYSVGGSALITPVTTSISTGKFRFKTQFLATTSTTYRLIIHIATTNASAWNLYVDNVFVGVHNYPHREVLVGTRNYYVRTDGSNSNTGLANTAGGAFLTVQQAINTIAGLDINTRAVNINVADGTYTTPIVVQGAWLGSGTVSIIGNTGTPANVIFSTTSADCIRCINGAAITLSGFEVRTTTLGQGVRAESTGFVTLSTAMRFGAVANSQIYAETNSVIFSRSAYTVAGSAQCHEEAVTSGVLDLAGITITTSGTPAFSTAWARSSRSGAIQNQSNTYSGTGATGKRYDAQENGVIFTNSGGSATYLPGDVNGTTATGGQYS
jgi:hypothetical protein